MGLKNHISKRESSPPGGDRYGNQESHPQGGGVSPNTGFKNPPLRGEFLLIRNLRTTSPRESLTLPRGRPKWDFPHCQGRVIPLKGETKRIFKTTLPREGDLEHNVPHNFPDYLDPHTQGRVFPPKGETDTESRTTSPRETSSLQGRVRYGA
jgi:hypothetical protein